MKIIVFTIFLFSLNLFSQNKDPKIIQERILINGNVKHSYSFYIIPFENGNTDSFIKLSKQYSSQKNK